VTVGVDGPASGFPGRPAIVPTWLRRAAAFAWRVLVIVALGALLMWLAGVLGTVTAAILLSVVVAATFLPLQRRLEARGWSTTKAAAMVTATAVAVALAIFIVALLAFVPAIVELASAIRTGAAQAASSLEDVTGSSAAVQSIQDAVNSVHAWVGGAIGAFAGRIATLVTVAILALFLIFFVLEDGRKAWSWAREAVTPTHREPLARRGLDAIEHIGGYVRGTTALAAVRAVAYVALMLLLGVPLAGPLAVLVFFGAFIPFLGPLIAAGAVLLVAMPALDLPRMLILIAFVVVELWAERRYLRPRLLDRSVELSPALVLVALPIGAYLAGLFGLFMAVPVMAFAVAMGGTIIDLLRPASEPESGMEVAGWIDRLAQWSWRALAILAVLGVAILLIAQIPLVIIPVLVAAILAATVAPLARRLELRGWGRSRAALAVTGGAFVLIVSVVVIAFAALIGPLSQAVQAGVEGASVAGDATNGALGWLVPLSETIGGDIVEFAGALLDALGSFVLILVLSPLLAFFFLRDAPRGWAALTSRTTAWRRPALDDGGGRAVEILGGYMLGTAAISAVGAISQYAIMVILGLPLAVPIAILSFIACFIPYIGGFVTTGLAFLVAVAFGEPAQIVVMFVYTIVINIVQGNIVTPLVYNRAVSLHPAVVLLAIPAGGALAGIAGMFLAVPVLAVIAATWRSVLMVLGDEPAATPPPAAAIEPAGATALAPGVSG
jgi:putative heme transporter